MNMRKCAHTAVSWHRLIGINQQMPFQWRGNKSPGWSLKLVHSQLMGVVKPMNSHHRLHSIHFPVIALHWYRFKASVFPIIATVIMQLFLSFITTWLKKKKQLNKKAQHNQFIRQLLVKYLFVYPFNYTYLLRILNSRLRSTITINIVTFLGTLGPLSTFNVSTEDKQTTKDTCLYEK